MTRLRPSAAYQEFDWLARLADQGAAHDWLDRMRPRLASHRDPLTRARFLLRCGALVDTRQPMQAVVDGLVAALPVLHAAGQLRDLVHCLAGLAYWYHRCGLMAPALACGELVLARPELQADERLRLQVTLGMNLAQQRLLPEAWAVLEQAETQAGASASLVALRGLLHAVEAMRARRLPTLYTLDLAPAPADEALAQRHLAACAACVQSGGHHLSVYLRAVLAAMSGDRAGVQRLLDRQAEREPTEVGRALSFHYRGWCMRVAGELDQAQADQREALAAVARLDAPRQEAQICHELALCCQAGGDVQGALAWSQQQQRAMACMQQRAHRALIRLAELLAALGWETPTSASVRAALVQAARSASPRQVEPLPETDRPVSAAVAADEGPIGLLARAQSVYIDHLPRRMAYPRLAQTLGVSVRTLQAAARRHTDMTLGELLRRQVLQRALALLCQAEQPIAEVAQQLGYADPGSFSRDVRRHFGCTPTELRAGLARPGVAVVPTPGPTADARRAARA